MLRHIFEKELQDCLYGYRSLLLFVLSTALFFVAVFAGTREYQTALQEFRLAEVTLRQHLAAETNLYALANFGFSLVKPPQVLSVLVSGVEPHAPRVYNFGLYSLPEPQGSSASENPTVAVFGALDLSFIVQVVLGLAALLFTFSAVCGEKEMGTLKLQLANAVPKDVLLIGKLAGNLAGLLAPVVLAFLLACIGFLNSRDVQLGRAEILRIALLGFTFVLYLTVLFALGLCISTFTTRSTTAFALCLVAWVLLVGIIPKFAVLAATHLAPAESLQEFELKKLQIHRRGSMDAQAEFNKYIEEYGGRMPPLELYEKSSARVRNWQNQELRKLEDHYLQQRERQARTALMLSRFSPAGSASYAAMSLAGTGLERDFRFRAALREYRSQFTAYYDRKSRELVDITSRKQIPNTMVELDFTDMPSLSFTEQSLDSALDAALPDLGSLAVWALVLFAIAYFRFLRYDVR
ncbi:MAG TPA: ABC transporter permease subunit [Terriglobia bacterium]|nr:ABC transporter permease subunit [Terriglobia bacterium]